MAKAKPANNSVTKPLGEEFFLDTDFAGIAEALALEIDLVTFSIEDTETDHTLTGVAK